MHKKTGDFKDRNFGCDKRLWLEKAKKAPFYFVLRDEISNILERESSFALNSMQIMVEACAIISLLISEHDNFSGMTECQIAYETLVFLNAYLCFRNVKQFPGIQYAHSTSNNFEKDFLKIANKANRWVRIVNYLNYPPQIKYD